jgi:hypothetical protein
VQHIVCCERISDSVWLIWLLLVLFHSMHSDAVEAALAPAAANNAVPELFLAPGMGDDME